MVRHSILKAAFASSARLCVGVLLAASCTATLDADELYFAAQSSTGNDTTLVDITLGSDTGPVEDIVETVDVTPDTPDPGTTVEDVPDVPVVVDVPDVGEEDVKMPPTIVTPGATCNVRWKEESELCGLALPKDCATTCNDGWVFTLETTAINPVWTFKVTDGFLVAPANSTQQVQEVTVTFQKTCEGNECGGVDVVPPQADLLVDLSAEGELVKETVKLVVGKDATCPAVVCF